MNCSQAASVASLIAKGRPNAEALEAAGQLERHYSKQCACYRTNNDNIGMRKPVHIDWHLFEDSSGEDVL